MKFFLKICYISLFILFPSIAMADDNANIKKNYELISGTDFISLGKFGNWESFFLEQDNEILCWASSKPQSIVDDNGKKIDSATQSVLITSIRPDYNIRHEFSYHSDKKLNEDIEQILSIDKKSDFSLKAQGRWAWLKTSLDEGRFVLSAQNGNSVIIKSSLVKGQTIIETYSLNGYTKAYKTAFNRCSEFFEDNKDKK